VKIISQLFKEANAQINRVHIGSPIAVKHESMKLNRNKQDTRTHHKFDLAGWPATIRADGYFWDLGIITTSVRLKGIEPISGCLIGAMTPAGAKRQMKEIERERKQGAKRPDFKPGHLVDIGFAEFDPAIHLLCLAAGLNPKDCTDFEYVEMTVRAAAMALVRKMAGCHTGKRSRATRSELATSFDPFEL
jgi:hypothetical protein